jgi:hypothetical protein
VAIARVCHRIEQPIKQTQRPVPFPVANNRLKTPPQVASKQMVGLYVSVWVRKRLARFVRGVQTTSAATGWGGYVGNKGEGRCSVGRHDLKAGC